VSEWREDTAWPDVDVVMPIRNEAAHLAIAVAAVRAQTYPGAMRVIMAVGPSGDATAEIAQSLSAADPGVLVVENPAGEIPSALNHAIRAGSAPVVVRVDGHSKLPDGYIEQAVRTLRRTGAANVGGLQVPVPTTPFSAAVAAATTSLLGTGGASYRTGGPVGPVDTVFLGVFDRAAIEAVGLYDERLLRNEDYELNIRLRQAGHDVMLDPSLAVGYTPRGSWSALARQYYQYGIWKSVVLRMHPGSLRLRQFVAPLGVLTVALSLLAAARWRRALIVPIGYVGTIAATGTGRPMQRVRTLAVTVTIHTSWVCGLIVGAVTHRSDSRNELR